MIACREARFRLRHGARGVRSYRLFRFRAGPARHHLVRIVKAGINSEENASSAVAFCSWLVGKVPVLPLTYSDADQATDLIVERLGRKAVRYG